MASHSFLFLYMLVTLSLVGMAFSDLDDDFYDDVCPKALPTIKRVVEDAVRKEKRMGASLLRLHFHDCFVNVRFFFSHLVFFIHLCIKYKFFDNGVIDFGGLRCPY